MVSTKGGYGLPGIFLSHSSRDKELVTKLACDLTLGGFHVWFDSWEVEIGESLYDRVFGGIDDATFLVLCLSPSSVESRWVLDELDAALAKEEALGRRVILPVLVAGCELPAAIACRMLADLSREYLKGLEDLKVALRRGGADEVTGRFDARLVPLRLRRGLYLQRAELQRYYEERLVPSIRDGATLSSGQVVAMPDEKLEEMRSVFRTTVDEIDSHPGYTPDLENYFRQRYGQIEKLDEGMREGVADIANGLVAMNEGAFFSEACFWFVQIARHKMLYILAHAWKFSAGDSPPLGVEAIAEPLGNSDHAARLYGVTDVISCDVFSVPGEYMKIWVGRDSDVWRRFTEMPYVREALGSVADPCFYHKYLVPQMVACHRLWSSGPLAWNLPGSWNVGRS